MWRLISRLVPESLKTRVRGVVREWCAPRMIYRYRNCDGLIRANTRLSSTVVLLHPEKIDIADHVFVWHYSVLDGTAGLAIGEGTQIGAWVGLFTHSSHIAIRLLGRKYVDVPEGEKPGFVTGPVTVGRFAFIGAGSVILPGVTIGDYSLVSAGSVVRQDVPAHGIVSGNPARVVGSTIDLDLLELARLDSEARDHPLLDREYVQEIVRLREERRGAAGEAKPD